MADAAIDHVRLEAELAETLAEAVTYRWLYLELCRRFLTAEHRVDTVERQMRALMAADQPPDVE